MLRLDHVALEVSDLDAAIVFYTKKLALTLKTPKHIDEEQHEAFAFLELEGGNIELLQRLDDENQPIPMEPQALCASLCPHVAIGTPDIAVAMGRLTREGVPIIKGPLEIPGKVRWLYANDPDNNIIEFVQWLEE